MKACDSEWDSFKAGVEMRRWYRGGGLLVRKYSQFLATVRYAELGLVASHR
jgi:hypothetical protein